jgi:septum formation protein
MERGRESGLRSQVSGGGSFGVRRIILASTSPWRLQILRDAGIEADGVAPDVDETTILGAIPEETARHRAVAKAVEVSRRRPDDLVIGADQVAHLDGEAFGKPTSTEDWRERLRALRGKAHTLTTAVALAEDGALADSFSVDTRVSIRGDLTDEEIEAYIASGEGRACAGGYMAEKRGAWLVQRIEGDWQNVIGLPLFPLLDRLRARGYRLHR